MDNNRKLFSGNNSCSADCKYCFAKWDDYARQATIDVWQGELLEQIIYPCCDSDINDNWEAIHKLWRIAERCAKVCVSISTKRTIEEDYLIQYSELNRYLKQNKKGFVKISVSVTTKHKVAEIEPGTDHFETRRMFFEELQHKGFQTSLILKPILPFISIDEYKEIISDFSTCDYFLIGNLYVNANSAFYKTYIQNQYDADVREKDVAWLDLHPRWKYVLQNEKLFEIERYIKTCGKEVFYKDVDVINRMAEKLSLQEW